MKTKRPAKTNRTRLSADERKEAITRAVIPAFAEKGFAATTTKDLAKAANVSEALLYRHFPSKESLYAHIQEQICSSDSSIHDFVYGLEPSSESIVKLVYLVFKIVFDTRDAHPLGNAVSRLQIQSLLEDGAFVRSFNEPRYDQMLPHMQDCAEVALAAGDMVAGPLTHNERLWFPHHLAIALRLSVLPGQDVFDYVSSPAERQTHAAWFALRGIGMKDKVITRYLKPEKLDPLIDDVLFRAGIRIKQNLPS